MRKPRKRQPVPTFERVSQLLDYSPEDGSFRWKVTPTPSVNAGDIAGGVSVLGYRRIRVDGALYLAHQLAILLGTGHWPEGPVRHLDGNRSNDRLSNLFELPPGTPKPENTSGFTGVTFHAATGKYMARLRIDGRVTYLGTFETPEEANDAREAAIKRLIGQ